MTGAPAASGGARWPSAARLVSLAVELAPVALVIVAEAAWISVFAGLFQEFALHDPVLGIPVFAAFVLAGIVLARLVGPRLDRRWPGVAFGLVLGAALVGWLASPMARDALHEGWSAAFTANPGGWFAGIALLRGMADGRRQTVDDLMDRRLAIGIPSLALAATIGGVIAEPYRSRFLADALGASAVFIVAAVLAMSLARLDAMGSDSAVHWRRNPTWLMATVALLVAAVTIAIAASTLGGSLVASLLSAAIGPLLLIGLWVGSDRQTRYVAVFLILGGIGLPLLVRLFGADAPAATPHQAASGSQAVQTISDPRPAVDVGGLVLLGAIIVLVLVLGIWLRRAPVSEPRVREMRTIDSSVEAPPAMAKRGRRRFRPEPMTAAEAYVALIEDLDGSERVRRDPTETPTGHARRLRADGRSELGLDLLAADYALSRYGGRVLAANEDRRAIARWRDLRRRLKATVVTERSDGPPTVPAGPDLR